MQAQMRDFDDEDEEVELGDYEEGLDDDYDEDEDEEYDEELDLLGDEEAEGTLSKGSWINQSSSSKNCVIHLPVLVLSLSWRGRIRLSTANI